MVTLSTVLAWKIPGTEEPGGATVHGVAESDTTHTPGTLSLAFLVLFPACNTCHLLIC